MSKQREALRIGLQAMEDHAKQYPHMQKGYTVDAIEALRQALAEPEPWTPDDMAYRPGGLSMSAEQEPVAWMMVNKKHGHKPTLHWTPQEDWHITWKAVPLYTAPPARKPLTDEQIDAEFDRECWVTVVFADGTRGIALDRVTARDFARAIERAHGISDD